MHFYVVIIQQTNASLGGTCFAHWWTNEKDVPENFWETSIDWLFLNWNHRGTTGGFRLLQYSSGMFDTQGISRCLDTSVV